MNTLAAAQALNPLDARSWLSALGAFGVFLVMFAETGLLVGFFLPGDSLLFTAGLLCTTSTTSTLHLSLATVIPAAAGGALLGAQVGFVLGQRAGSRLLADGRHPRLQEGAKRAEQMLVRYGHGRAIVIGRFIPVVRTVLNPLAGALAVPTKTFTIWQVAGGLVWSIGLTLAGYGLGSSVPNVDKYLLPIVAVIVVVSLIPLAVELLRARKEQRSPVQ